MRSGKVKWIPVKPKNPKKIRWLDGQDYPLNYKFDIHDAIVDPEGDMIWMVEKMIAQNRDRPITEYDFNLERNGNRLIARLKVKRQKYIYSRQKKPYVP